MIRVAAPGWGAAKMESVLALSEEAKWVLATQ
jgi:hypothetical protein